MGTPWRSVIVHFHRQAWTWLSISARSRPSDSGGGWATRTQGLFRTSLLSLPTSIPCLPRPPRRICPCVSRKVTRFLCPPFSESPIAGTQLQQCFPEKLYTHVLASSVICYVPSSCHNRKCSLTAYSVPHTVLSPFHEVSHSILTTSQEGSHYYPSHVTDRPTETP